MRTLEKKTENKVVYDPRSTYEWKADELYPILGIEIDKINKALIAASSTPEFQKTVTIFEGLVAFQNFFKEGVESGLFVQKKDDETENSELLPETTAEAVLEKV